jgi:transposase-like protein
MPPSKPPYRPEFKTEAVSFYHRSGKNLQEIASDLGVSTNSLREWVRRTNGENASKGKSRTSATSTIDELLILQSHLARNPFRVQGVPEAVP